MSGNSSHGPNPKEAQPCPESKLRLRGSALENENTLGAMETKDEPFPNCPVLGPFYYPASKFSYKG
jgi:hypothetical protein